jgi:hypothetical protein
VELIHLEIECQTFCASRMPYYTNQSERSPFSAFFSFVFSTILLAVNAAILTKLYRPSPRMSATQIKA